MFRETMAALLCLVCSGSVAHAWGDRGHEVVGALAEDALIPAAKEFVRGAIGIEALYVAATWPDHARDDVGRFTGVEEYYAERMKSPREFSPYHFCDIPTGFDYASSPKHNVKDARGAIIGATKILKDGSAKRESRAIAMRYLVHLIGDIHQPLHVGNGYDHGANACSVKVENHVVNLHHFWDDNAVSEVGKLLAEPADAKAKPIRYVNEFVAGYKRKHPDWFQSATREKWGKGSLDSWIKESADSREANVYPDDPADMAGVPPAEKYKHRKYCVWYLDQDKDTRAPGVAIDPTKIPELTTAYVTNAGTVAETQLMKAGIRLAATLDLLARESAGAPKVSDAEQGEILDSIQAAFRNDGDHK